MEESLEIGESSWVGLGSLLVIVVVLVSLWFVPLPLRHVYAYQIRLRAKLIHAEAKPTHTRQRVCLSILIQQQKIRKNCQTMTLRTRATSRKILAVRYVRWGWRRLFEPPPAFRDVLKPRLEWGTAEPTNRPLLRFVFHKTTRCEETSCQRRQEVLFFDALPQQLAWLKKLQKIPQQAAVMGDVLSQANHTKGLLRADQGRLTSEVKQAAVALQDVALFDACAKRKSWSSWKHLGKQGLVLLEEAAKRYNEAKQLSQHPDQIKLPTEKQTTKKKTSSFGKFIKDRIQAHLCKKGRRKARKAYRWHSKVLRALVEGKPLPKRSLMQRAKRSMKSAVRGLKGLLFRSKKDR